MKTLWGYLLVAGKRIFTPSARVRFSLALPLMLAGLGMGQTGATGTAKLTDNNITVGIVDPSYNFILPRTIPSDGLYTCKIQAHVLEIVEGKPPEHHPPIIVVFGLAFTLGLLAACAALILVPTKKEVKK